MGIAGLGTYSSTSFYYKMTSQGDNTNVNDKFDLGLVLGQNNNQDETADTVGKPARTSVTVPYTRCITTTIQTEEMYASQSENGEMVYSYKASEQSFNIYINSDGKNKTYSIEGIDKDGQPFTKEFDPYDVDPEYADFPEFAALCLYIQNTDETADMLANDYFATDDILEKCDYLEKLQGFGTDARRNQSAHQISGNSAEYPGGDLPEIPHERCEGLLSERGPVADRQRDLRYRRAGHDAELLHHEAAG